MRTLQTEKHRYLELEKVDLGGEIGIPFPHLDSESSRLPSNHGGLISLPSIPVSL